MVEDLQGRGAVLNAKTREGVVSGVEYALRVQHSRRGELGHTDVFVQLDGALARRLISSGEKLTLQLEDGREIDFFVQHVSGDGRQVRVTATGPLRATTRA
jgi:hypothetical protein